MTFYFYTVYTYSRIRMYPYPDDQKLLSTVPIYSLQVQLSCSTINQTLDWFQAETSTVQRTKRQKHWLFAITSKQIRIFYNLDAEFDE